MNTWWIDKPILLGSANPTNADLTQLRRDGFTVIISLLREDIQEPGYDITIAKDLGFERHNIPVQDFCPPTMEQLDQFIKLINRLPPRTKTIIRCEGGSGRTGTFAAAYWIAKGMTAIDAFEHVRKNLCHAIETHAQEEILAEFANNMPPKS